ncbi:hypothetical protein [uncultured Fibrobacter sp.]|jgi:hypothetical protein|uniref:hypothetical protein n=1 Tax=uncultured Fibrobacter sp. TaxID=261512 RepID=UPI0025FF0BA1|nr:hypothetical protein [uncultured Fibrobacter sp.]
MKIMILVNKDFEYAGYRAGIEKLMMLNKIPDLKMVSRDWSVGPSKNRPSCIYKLGKHIIREFCISYLFDAGESTSNSQKKLDLVMNLIDEESPDYIISVSTSESTPCKEDRKRSFNGCIFMGTKFFAKDCRKLDSATQSHLYVPEGWCVQNSSICANFFDIVNKKSKNIADGMEAVPHHPANKLTIFANTEYVSLGIINVMDYSCYEKADPETYNEFKNNYSSEGEPVCLETTHAVVKMAAGQIPVLFVSPIVDRYNQFKHDVDNTWGNQNAIGSYNAGIVVANMLEILKDKLKDKL